VKEKGLLLDPLSSMGISPKSFLFLVDDSRLSADQAFHKSNRKHVKEE
jgi:hypothetical protein